jgi:hypothetical protein
MTELLPITDETDDIAIDPRPMAFEEDGDEDPIPAILARNFRRAVGDIFRKGVAVWSRDLVDARNEVLIMVRARLAGGDPQEEWGGSRRLGCLTF